ncbi:MAG: hypothetical protein M1358_01265 [Chloroflexi bacterium]|nr:hypothetical protein [Chloroflexota bacterium]
MGHWETRNTDYTSYLDANVVNCDLCGKMIPKEIWINEVEGETKQFCDDRCEAMYISYWLPKYGPKAKSS